MKKIMTIAEVAKELQCSENSVRRMMEDGKLEFVQCRPRMIRISRDALLRFLQGESRVNVAS